MKRSDRLIPNGIPRWIRCYDNGGPDVPRGTIDRYTVVFTGKYRHRNPDGKMDCWHQYLAMDANPFYAQGFCQHGENESGTIDTPTKNNRRQWAPAIGRKCHLGTRIRFEDLPKDCQKVVISDYAEIWNLKVRLAA